MCVQSHEISCAHIALAIAAYRHRKEKVKRIQVEITFASCQLYVYTLVAFNYLFQTIIFIFSAFITYVSTRSNVWWICGFVRAKKNEDFMQKAETKQKRMIYFIHILIHIHMYIV